MVMACRAAFWTPTNHPWMETLKRLNIFVDNFTEGDYAATYFLTHCHTDHLVGIGKQEGRECYFRGKRLMLTAMQ